MYSIWVGPEKGFMHLSILQMKRRGVLDPRPDNRVNGVSCYHPRRCPITPQLCQHSSQSHGAYREKYSSEYYSRELH